MVPVERRAFRRLEFNVDIAYQIAPASGAQASSKTHSKDISAGGIRLVTLESLAVNTTLDLQFILPGSAQPIHTTGKVVWVDKFTVGSIDSSPAYDAGVQFIAITPEDRKKIDQYILTKS